MKGNHVLEFVLVAYEEFARTAPKIDFMELLRIYINEEKLKPHD